LHSWVRYSVAVYLGLLLAGVLAAPRPSEAPGVSCVSPPPPAVRDGAAARPDDDPARVRVSEPARVGPGAEAEAGAARPGSR